jgi:molybdopterin-containing oxidoreductase family iron-sulfur binding subunit
MNNDLGKMVLNPDVTVRARGVMEKCTFCVQRIQSGKLQAKRESRRPVDGEISTACASACPSDALVFGDMKDPNSRISKTLKLKEKEKGVEAQEPRAYHVLEELRVMPNVWYLTKIRNKDENAKAEA